MLGKSLRSFCPRQKAALCEDLDDGQFCKRLSSNISK